MTEPVVNPLVGEDQAEELAALESTVTRDADVPAPIAEATSTQPIERRSRRAGKQQPTAEEKPQPVDLTQFEEFRQYQADRDRQLEAERKKAVDLQRQMEERQQKEAFDRMQYLESVMDDDARDLDERKSARQEYLLLNAQTYTAQWQRWETYKRTAITEAGLDPNDARFQRQYSPGQAGLAEFQADLTSAENAKLKAELTEAKKKAVTPETLADLVRQELAKLTKQTGLDAVDMGEPDAASDDDAWERDAAAFNSGRMSAAEYSRKWGHPLR